MTRMILAMIASLCRISFTEYTLSSRWIIPRPVQWCLFRHPSPAAFLVTLQVTCEICRSGCQKMHSSVRYLNESSSAWRQVKVWQRSFGGKDTEIACSGFKTRPDKVPLQRMGLIKGFPDERCLLLSNFRTMWSDERGLFFTCMNPFHAGHVLSPPRLTL